LRAGANQRRTSRSVPFGRTPFLVTPVALPLGNDLFGFAAPVCRERLSDIDLVLSELSLIVTAGIAFVARMRLDDWMI
jgi:hypothetical protein